MTLKPSGTVPRHVCVLGDVWSAGGGLRAQLGHTRMAECRGEIIEIPGDEKRVVEQSNDGRTWEMQTLLEERSRENSHNTRPNSTARDDHQVPTLGEDFPPEYKPKSSRLSRNHQMVGGNVVRYVIRIHQNKSPRKLPREYEEGRRALLLACCYWAYLSSIRGPVWLGESEWQPKGLRGLDIWYKIATVLIVIILYNTYQKAGELRQYARNQKVRKSHHSMRLGGGRDGKRLAESTPRKCLVRNTRRNAPCKAPEVDMVTLEAHNPFVQIQPILETTIRGRFQQE
ncbi:hypothetical protein BDV93DRAFT_509255 [Ceratobasidium sp. AG-I]|nr:hypothetical protein BDV93DRAFT_509255 [Ceratobasidium sp. AG-I]